MKRRYWWTKEEERILIENAQKGIKELQKLLPRPRIRSSIHVKAKALNVNIGKRVTLADSLEKDVLQMHRQGYTFRLIAKILGCSLQPLIKIRKKYGLKSNATSEMTKRRNEERKLEVANLYGCAGWGEYVHLCRCIRSNLGPFPGVIGPSQLRFLFTLAENGGMTRKELIETLGITCHDFHLLVAKLKKREKIISKRYEHSRYKIYELSPKTLAHYTRYMEERNGRAGRTM